MAGKDYESTLKFKADITGLRQAMNQARNSIKIVNEQFKQNVAGLEKWEITSQGVEAKLRMLGSQYKSQKDILKALVEQHKLVSTEYGKNSKQAETLSVQIERQKTAIAKTEAELKKYGKSLADIKGSTPKSEMEKLTTTINAQSQKLTELKKKYSDYVVSGKQSTNEAKELRSQIKNLSSELEKNKSKFTNASKEADKLDKSLNDVENSSEQATSGLSAIDVALGNIIARGVEKTFTSIVDFGKNVIETGMNFESSMSKVQAISGGTAEDVDKLTKKAKEMGESTVFSASQSADALQYMALAGWKTDDMLNGLGGVLNLAAAGGEDLAQVSDIVTDGLTAMGYSAKDSNRFADVLAATMSNSNTTVGLFGETLKYVGAIAGQYGYSMEDVALATGLVANAGIKGTIAGTGLSSIITRLATDAGASSNQLGALGTLTKELGVQFYDASGKARPFRDVILESQEAWHGLTVEQQANYGKTIAGQEALKTWSSLMNASKDDVDKLAIAIDNSNGKAEEMATTMTDTLSGSLTLLKSQIEGKMLTLFEKMEPYLRDVVNEFSGFLEKIDWDKAANESGKFVKSISSLIKFLIENRRWIIATITAYIAYRTVMKQVNTDHSMLNTVLGRSKNAAGEWTRGLGLAKAGLAGWTSAIGLAITGVTALVGWLIDMKRREEEAREAAYKSTRQYQENAKALEEMKTATEEAQSAVEDIARRERELNDIKLDYSSARQLSDEIFEISNKADKSKDDVRILQEKVREFNNLGLEGIQFEFNDTGTEVINTKEKVDELITSAQRMAETSAIAELVREDAKQVLKVSEALDSATNNYNKLNGEAEQTSQGLERAKAAIEWMNNHGGDFWKLSGDKFKDEVTGVEKTYNEWSETVKNLETRYNDLNKKREEAKQSMDKEKKSLDELAESGERHKRIQQIQTENNVNLAEATRIYNEEQKNSKDIIKDASTATEIYNKSLDRIKENDAFILLDQQAKEAIEDIIEKIKSGEITYEDGKNMILEYSNGFMDTFTDIHAQAYHKMEAIINDINSGKVTYQDGVAMLEGFRDGQESTFNDIRAKAQSKIISIMNDIRSGKVSYNDGYNSLSNYERGLFDELNNILGIVSDKTSAMVDVLANAALSVAGFNFNIQTSTTKRPKQAVGSIYTKATDITVGEDGKEVLMPLERHTGWIDTLAYDIYKRINKKPFEGGGSNKTVINNYNNNYTQTINSNKALDSYEIYKNTNKLLTRNGGTA